jgi:hypothetical protein
VNDVVAAAVTAALASIVHDRLRRLAGSPRLSHLGHVNGFFSRLAYECRTGARFHLIEWWGVARWEQTGRFRVPRRAGSHQCPERTLRFFLRGRSRDGELFQAGRKLVGYRRVAGSRRRPMCSSSSSIAVVARPKHRSLYGLGMPVATMTKGMAGGDPPRAHLAPAEMGRGVTLLDLSLAEEAE